MPYLKLLALTALIVPNIAQARDLSGDYSGNCDEAVQCAVEITNHTAVSVIVADRLDYSKKSCVVSGTLQDTPSGLAGLMKAGMKVFVVSTPDGGIYLNGIPAKTCGRNLNGYYSAIGD